MTREGEPTPEKKAQMTMDEWKTWKNESPNEFKQLDCPRCGKETAHLPRVDQKGVVVCQGSEGGCWSSHDAVQEGE